MLGPLPYVHRVILVTALLLTAVASGAWIAHFTLIPVAVGGGAVVGALAGLLVSYAALHAGHRPEPARVRRQGR